METENYIVDTTCYPGFASSKWLADTLLTKPAIILNSSKQPIPFVDLDNTEGWLILVERGKSVRLLYPQCLGNDEWGYQVIWCK